MKLYLVRHGHPNYEKDCLTELGHLHAAAAAKRLADSGIEKIYSSSCGRALETAQHTADVLGIKDIELLDFMREVRWGSRNGEEIFEHGRPWSISDKMAGENRNYFDPDWQNNEYYSNNILMDNYERMFSETDKFLAELGIVRDGLYYRVGECKHKTVALFSHAGSSSVFIARLFNLPYPFVTSAICPDYTAITVVSFDETAEGLVAPKFDIANDSRHIEGISL